MAGKKSKNDIEIIRGDINKLTEAVWALRDQVQSESAVLAASRVITPAPVASFSGSPDHQAETEASDTMSGFGYYEIPESGSAVRWNLSALAIPDMVNNTPETSASILAAAGHPQRLAILGYILQKPASAGELVEALSLGTTGAAYHHLNVLQAAGFVTQLQRGIFRFQPDRIPVFVTMLAALNPSLQVEVVDTTPAADNS
jgi:DNA-binding transcriptional ArsR family regulator